MSRRRQWWLALAVVGLALALSLAWSAFALVRTGHHPRGEVAFTHTWQAPEGHSVSLKRWDQTDILVSDFDRKKAPPGAVWVQVTLEFHNLPEDFTCTAVLRGRGQTSWRQASGSGVPLTDGMCPLGDQNEGLAITTFLVPTAKLGEIRGVELDHSMMLRQPPLFTKP